MGDQLKGAIEPSLDLDDELVMLSPIGSTASLATELKDIHGDLAWHEANRRLTSVANRQSPEFALWSSVAFALVHRPPCS